VGEQGVLVLGSPADAGDLKKTLGLCHPKVSPRHETQPG
jgi:hypothetical protein